MSCIIDDSKKRKQYLVDQETESKRLKIKKEHYAARVMVMIEEKNKKKLKSLQNELDIIFNQLLFLTYVHEGKITPCLKNKTEFADQLQKYHFARLSFDVDDYLNKSYDYIIDMSMSMLTSENMKQLGE